MKLCPKLYLNFSIMANIVSYLCMTISCANYFLVPLDSLPIKNLFT
jgi:hypothetical protein